MFLAMLLCCSCTVRAEYYSVRHSAARVAESNSATTQFQTEKNIREYSPGYITCELFAIRCDEACAAFRSDNQEPNLIMLRPNLERIAAIGGIILTVVVTWYLLAHVLR